MLYVLDDPNQPSTIGQIYRTLKTEHDITDVVKHVLDSDEFSLDTSARMSLGSFLNKAPKERSGVRSNLSERTTTTFCWTALPLWDCSL